MPFPMLFPGFCYALSYTFSYAAMPLSYAFSMAFPMAFLMPFPLPFPLPFLYLFLSFAYPFSKGFLCSFVVKTLSHTQASLEFLFVFVFTFFFPCSNKRFVVFSPTVSHVRARGAPPSLPFWNHIDTGVPLLVRSHTGEEPSRWFAAFPRSFWSDLASFSVDVECLLGKSEDLLKSFRKKKGF